MKPHAPTHPLRRLLGAFGLMILLATPAAQAQDIPVGMLVPITSVLAAYGTPYVESVKLAFEKANAGGGINGRKIELVVEDTQASNTVAINALNKVLQSNPVATFGPALGTQVLAMMPITEREKLTFIAGPSTRRVTQQNAAYFFRSSSHDALAKENWTRFIVDTLGKKKVGILHVANEWGYSGRDNTTNFLDKLYGLKPVSVASYQPTDKDLTAQLVQMGRDGADVIVVQGHPVDEALIVRQLNQLGIKTPAVFSGSLCFAYLRNLITPAEMAGRYCDGPGEMPIISERPEMKAFVEAYKKRTGFAPDTYTAFYYDAAGMLVQALRSVGPDREKLRNAMRSMSYAGVTGTLKADEEGNLWNDAVLMQFQSDGSAKVVRRFRP